MRLFLRVAYLAAAGLWAFSVHRFFASAGQYPEHLHAQVALYTAVADIPALLLIAAGLTSRLARPGYTIRWLALFSVAGAFGFLMIAAMFGFGFVLIGGKLPNAVLPLVLLGFGPLGMAGVFLLLDVLVPHKP